MQTLSENGKYSEEDGGSSDEDDGKHDGTDAVQHSRCQHPVVRHLALLVVVAALLFVATASLQNVADFPQLVAHRLQQRVGRLVVRRFVERRRPATVVVVGDGDAQTRHGREFRRRLLHAQTRRQSLAEQRLHLLRRAAQRCCCTTAKLLQTAVVKDVQYGVLKT